MRRFVFSCFFKSKANFLLENDLFVGLVGRLVIIPTFMGLLHTYAFFPREKCIYSHTTGPG